MSRAFNRERTNFINTSISSTLFHQPYESQGPFYKVKEKNSNQLVSRADNFEKNIYEPYAPDVHTVSLPQYRDASYFQYIGKI